MDVPSSPHPPPSVSSNNGRIRWDGTQNSSSSLVPPSPFQLFAEDARSDKRGEVTSRESLKHIECNDVSSTFFDSRNVDALQDAIRYRVWLHSDEQHTIGRQSDVELHAVMRAIYLEYGRNDPTSSVASQVRELNARTLSFCVPRIISEVDMYLQFLRDVSQLPVPIARSQLETSRGTRVLEMWRRQDDNE